MRRAHPGLMIALAAAALAGGNQSPAPNVQVVSASQAQANHGGFGLTRLAGLFGGAPSAILGGGGYRGFGGAGGYRSKFPVSVAQAKRHARKRRNVLRARGHHRKAVR